MNALPEQQRFIILCIKKPLTGTHEGTGRGLVVAWDTLCRNVDKKLFDAGLKKSPEYLCDNVWLFLEEGSENVIKWIKQECNHNKIPLSMSRTFEHPEIVLRYNDADTIH